MEWVPQGVGEPPHVLKPIRQTPGLCTLPGKLKRPRAVLLVRAVSLSVCLDPSAFVHLSSQAAISDS